jgi:hypothetical protein
MLSPIAPGISRRISNGERRKLMSKQTDYTPEEPKELAGERRQV